MKWKTNTAGEEIDAADGGGERDGKGQARGSWELGAGSWDQL